MCKACCQQRRAAAERRCQRFYRRGPDTQRSKRCVDAELSAWVHSVARAALAIELRRKELADKLDGLSTLPKSERREDTWRNGGIRRAFVPPVSTPHGAASGQAR